MFSSWQDNAARHCTELPSSRGGESRPGREQPEGRRGGQARWAGAVAGLPGACAVESEELCGVGSF